MPIQASSSRKGKEKVMNRALRSFDSLIFLDGIPPSMDNELEVEGWDAPLEPTRHLSLEQSPAQAQHADGEAEERRG